MSLELLFGNDSGAAAEAGSDYERDVFKDVSLKADSNSGLTDTASTNPLSAKVGNCDTPAFNRKTLLIKEVQLIADRSKWVSQKPTYQIIFNEQLPSVFAYAYGSFVTNGLGSVAPWGGQDSPLSSAKYLQFAQANDGIGVTGKIRRLQWLVQGSTDAAATAMRVTDGSNTSTITFQNVAATSDTSGAAKFAAYVHEASNETNDLHDFRLVSQQQNTLKVIGVVVYFENTGANVEVFPGETYVDKVKVTTSSGATFAIPTFGSSMGGVFSLAKNASGYTLITQGASPIISVAQGSSGTNILAVTPGTGSSFLPGMGVVMNAGTSFYIGNVQSISTDSLTVFPTLSFGLSNTVYSAWLSGSTYSISQSMMAIETTIGASTITGMTNPILDPNGRYAIWGANVGITQSFNGKPGMFFRGASGFLQVEGYFQAADMQLLGNGGIFHATMSVNGLPAWSENAGMTGYFRRTLLTNAGNGWNSVVISPGSSMGAVLFTDINLYTSQPKTGITYGVLGFQRVNQAQAPRAAHNATMFSLGLQRRVFADQMMLTGAWTRGLTSTVPGGAIYYGTSTNAALDLQYYGKDFAVIGSFTGATLTVDGTGTAFTAGAPVSVGSYGFHTIRMTVGVTSTIQAFDFFADYDEMENVQNVLDAVTGAKREKTKWRRFVFASAGTYPLIIPAGGSTLTMAVVNACAGAGGGGRANDGGGSNANSAGGGASSAAVGSVLALTPGEYVVTVGIGGRGATTYGATGGTGMPTYIQDAAGNYVFYLDGGFPGVGSSGATGGAGGAGQGDGGSGGSGTGGTGTANLQGGTGQRARRSGRYAGGAPGAASGSNTASGGGGAASPFGVGGAGGVYNGAAGNGGIGGGGGGAGGSNAGTSGTPGDGGDGYFELIALMGDLLE